MSLIELVLLVGISVVVLSGSIRFTSTAVQRSVQSRDHLIALHLAKVQMAVMNEGAFPAVADTFPTDAAFGGYILRQRVTAVSGVSPNRLRQIEMTVTRTGGSYDSGALVKLFTYRQETTTFGNGL